VEVVRFIATTLPCRGRRVCRRHRSTTIFNPGSSQIRLEDFVDIKTIEEKSQATTIWTELGCTNGDTRRIEGSPVVHIVVASIQVGCSRFFRIKSRGICQSHLRTESTNIGTIGTASIRGSITCGVHATLCVGSVAILWRIVVPCNSKFLTQGIVEIRKGRGCINFELKLGMTIAINKDKSWLDVEGTEINVLNNLDHVTQCHTTLNNGKDIKC
jgi:hypothetical protein